MSGLRLVWVFNCALFFSVDVKVIPDKKTKKKGQHEVKLHELFVVNFLESHILICLGQGQGRQGQRQEKRKTTTKTRQVRKAIPSPSQAQDQSASQVEYQEEKTPKEARHQNRSCG